MIYVIRIEDERGGYVASKRFKFTYTHRLEEARGFSSPEKAYKEGGLCENERVVAIDSLISVEDGE